MELHTPQSQTDRIVMDGACIGCGLCAGISNGAIGMQFTEENRERPVIAGAPSSDIEDMIASSCPGLNIEGLSAEEAGPDANEDHLWGFVRDAKIAWAGNPDTRFRASTGGVLSALSAFLLETGEVDFVLHVGPDPDKPARSRWKISQTPQEAVDTGGSRYGPAAPLAGLGIAKDLVESGAARFAFVGKPCDVSAIRLLAKSQDWLAKSLTYKLTIMCGGASEFSKTSSLLANWGIKEEDLVELRYRGFGNPGPTTAKTRSGKTHATTYQELWEDESSWALQHRCKICADAIGMAADLVSFDCWPGGGPEGEDEGFNAVITRTQKGSDLLDRAAKAGNIELGRDLSLSDVADFQPHQVRKRYSVWARLSGQRAAGKTSPNTSNLFVEELARENGFSRNLDQARGTRERLKQGRGIEPKPISQHGNRGS